MECIGLRHVGYRFENGEPFVVLWHVASVTNLIISTESLTGANIEVQHSEREQHDHGLIRYSHKRGPTRVRGSALAEVASR